jgi:hypothetical protein
MGPRAALGPVEYRNIFSVTESQLLGSLACSPSLYLLTYPASILRRPIEICIMLVNIKVESLKERESNERN